MQKIKELVHNAFIKFRYLELPEDRDRHEADTFDKFMEIITSKNTQLRQKDIEIDLLKQQNFYLNDQVV